MNTYCTLAEIPEIIEMDRQKILNYINRNNFPLQTSSGYIKEEITEWFHIIKKINLWNIEDIVTFTGLSENTVRSLIRKKTFSPFKPKYRKLYGKNRFDPKIIIEQYNDYRDKEEKKKMKREQVLVIEIPQPKVTNGPNQLFSDTFPVSNLRQEKVYREPLWSMRDISNYIGYSQSTVADWVKKGYLIPIGKSKGIASSHYKKSLFRKHDVFNFFKIYSIQRKMKPE
jgi:predicted DNA-binding transcriptional regulator AlpA